MLTDVQFTSKFVQNCKLSEKKVYLRVPLDGLCEDGERSRVELLLLLGLQLLWGHLRLRLREGRRRHFDRCGVSDMERKRWVRTSFVRERDFRKCVWVSGGRRRKLESRGREKSGKLNWNSNVITGNFFCVFFVNINNGLFFKFIITNKCLSRIKILFTIDIR